MSNSSAFSRFLIHLQLILIALILLNCGSSTSNNSQPNVVTATIKTDVFKPVSSSLPISTASEVGLNEDTLLSTYQMAATQPDLRSLLVIKNQQLIAEAYFNNTNPNTKLHLRSVTKTVTAMLIGIAIEQGLLLGPDQKIAEFFIEDYPSLSSNKADITIGDLLTMTSGFLWNEAEYLNWESSNDPINYLLRNDLVYVPGNQFNYNSAAVHLLAVILDKVAANGLSDFAEQHLFSPLGILDFRWDKLKDGRYNGGAGLQLKAIDTAKFAMMLLDNGRLNDKQIVPESWVNQSKMPQIEFSNPYVFGTMNLSGYGYLRWLGNGNTENVSVAWGWGGQFITIVPDKELIVITNSRHNVVASQADKQEKANFEIIVNGVFAALD